MSYPGDIDAMLATLIERAPALRAAGIEHVALPGGLSVRLSAAAPTPPVAAALPVLIDEDDADPVAIAQREERELRARWDAAWKRLIASSGAPVPPFPANIADARRGMATLFGART
jgi:hypothetical protein